MAFWKVAGFAQPSPIEQILDKEEFTLEELLDEDDIIQECKSLNGRLIAFLKERKTIEQLLKYLVEPPTDAADPKQQYKYPFTACEVFCCEVEAVFNALLEDETLMALLFSLLSSPPPLSCKVAGYFGRVVGHLLLRKTTEMMQYLSNNDVLLERLVAHIDTTSIADIVKRLVGADDQAAMLFLPLHTQWLSETQLVEMLLERLAPGHSADVQANAGDTLCAIAHTQPSALASKLMQPDSIAALFAHALDPAGRVLVPALDVCIALLEPRRMQQEANPAAAEGQQQQQQQQPERSSSSGSGVNMQAAAAASTSPRAAAIGAVVQQLPALVEFLRLPSPTTAASEGQDATAADAAAAAAAPPPQLVAGAIGSMTALPVPYGLLTPPLGRTRLKVVELVAVLLRAGDESADAALVESGAVPLVLDLFVRYPFNNMLHHQAGAIIVACLRRGTQMLLGHLLGTCRLAGWLVRVPTEVTPAQQPGIEGHGPLRAGYLGHVTQIANVLVEAAGQQEAVAEALQGDEGWGHFVSGVLGPRNEVEDVTRWVCGRPTSTEMVGSDADDFQNDLDLEQMQGMQPTLYHRYGVLDDVDDDDDNEHEGANAAHAAGGDAFNANAYGSILADAMQRMDISDGAAGAEAGDGAAGGYGGHRAVGAGEPGDERGAQGGANIGSWSLLSHPAGAVSHAVDIPGERSMDDDAVLLASSDDEEMLPGDTDDPAAANAPSMLASAHNHESDSGPGESSSSGGEADETIGGLAMSPPGDDMVMVDEPIGAFRGSQETEPGAKAAGEAGAAGGGAAGGPENGREFGDFQYWRTPQLAVDVPEDA